MTKISLLNCLKQRWNLLLLILTPLILLPLPIIMNNSQARCGYIVLILSVYWISEVIPLPVTALLPLILFPMAGVLTADVVAPHYFKDIISLFFGSMAFGYAVEKVNLPRRIALFVLSWVGMATKWIMAGMMGATAFLSMWMNNTASTSIMLPVALAVVHELKNYSENSLNRQHVAVINVAFESTNGKGSDENKIEELTHTTQSCQTSKSETFVETNTHLKLLCCKRQKPEVDDKSKKKHDQLKKGFLLAVAYSSSIGGLSSLVGTAPNVYLKGFVESKYGGTGFRINFLNFLLFALPVGILMLILCWFWLQWCYNKQELFQCRPSSEMLEVQTHLKVMLNKQYKDLGRPKHITDGTVAIFCGILPLILPDSNPFNRKHDWKYEPIVKWTQLAQNVSWGSILLLGAGLTIATAFEKSKLSDSVAKILGFVSGVPRAAASIIIIIVSGFFTEVTSNTSTASIFLPVLDSVVTVMLRSYKATFSFFSNTATPPNAIVFASGAIRVVDMIKTGIVMNLIGFLVIFIAANTWMPKIFDINEHTTAHFFNITSVLRSSVDNL
ncbi:unnamed protein product [Rotaria magnacalcarata]|uniref:Solute carrier family 13 member 1 n=1 Tax=Rotaria magnacalcarata TaxID=392030 RepID=A0A816VSC4_9BILA|nr:unnamed protein product [Rotaria magnacalcarata]